MRLDASGKTLIALVVLTATAFAGCGFGSSADTSNLNTLLTPSGLCLAGNEQASFAADGFAQLKLVGKVSDSSTSIHVRYRAPTSVLVARSHEDSNEREGAIPTRLNLDSRRIAVQEDSNSVVIALPYKTANFSDVLNDARRMIKRSDDFQKTSRNGHVEVGPSSAIGPLKLVDGDQLVKLKRKVGKRRIDLICGVK